MNEQHAVNFDVFVEQFEGGFRARCSSRRCAFVSERVESRREAQDAAAEHVKSVR